METDKSIIKAYQKFLGSLSRKLNRLYNGINQRCNNPNNSRYNRYGGRGIKNLFSSSVEFFDYVLNELNIIDVSQIEGLQIDRIDNNGDYEPGNIRFITQRENMHNRGY